MRSSASVSSFEVSRASFVASYNHKRGTDASSRLKRWEGQLLMRIGKRALCNNRIGRRGIPVFSGESARETVARWEEGSRRIIDEYVLVTVVFNP